MGREIDTDLVIIKAGIAAAFVVAAYLMYLMLCFGFGARPGHLREDIAKKDAIVSETRVEHQEKDSIQLSTGENSYNIKNEIVDTDGNVIGYTVMLDSAE